LFYFETEVTKVKQESTEAGINTIQHSTMKLLLIACLTFSADAALSTIRSGPRKQLFNEGFEFGRPASILDLADVEKA